MEKKHMERYSTSEQSLNIIGEIKLKLKGISTTHL